MESKMKEATPDVITELQNCEIDTIMATGDNILTAVSVAGLSGIIDSSFPTFCGELIEDNTARGPYIRWSRSGDQNYANMSI